jgi:hypothetical protein
MKKVFFVTIILLFSFSMAYAASEISGDIKTDVQDTNVTTSSGFLGGDQDVNVGGVELQDTKMKSGSISTNVKDVNVTTSSGFLGGDQDVNVGGVKAK